jgi:hypothetical protein
MGTLLDQIFEYKMGTKVAFRDDLTKSIQVGIIQNRWTINGLCMYRVSYDGLVSFSVPEYRIIGFIKEKK